MNEQALKSKIERQRILVQGIVQGVGFRPFVYTQALRCGLAGSVLNDSSGVTIEVEGAPDALARFQQTLRDAPPPLARIDTMLAEALPPRGEATFQILHSCAAAERQALIAPDSATCDDCLRELFDPADRRYRYPFINCTNCGPRYTIVQDVPYDRDQTTMRVFAMCPACRAEYDNPLDRRFHAQPNACPDCGPILDFRVWILDWAVIQNPNSKIQNGNIQNPVDQAATALASGFILTIKGLGGYHLACDALNAEAVLRLRQRKQREAKPFALMVQDLAAARQLCQIGHDEATLLESGHRPIVLLRQHPDCPIALDIAPAHTTLGIMLPYTPLHHLLLHAFAAIVGTDRPAALVMTSGNLSDEPIAYHDDDARTRLAPIADGMLAHNRVIHMRCDDSVAQIAATGTTFLRRARGYAPEPIPLGFECPVPMLACGGQLKSTFCLAKGRQAFVSQHIGDLENLETLTAFRDGIAHYRRLFDIDPIAVAYDLHPNYLATQHALDLALPRAIGVQHHHAHIASVLAEHGLAGPVIGIAADGTGYGSDGAIWGCEIMAADLLAFERMAHLAYVPLPGGDQAVRQPWRMAAVYLAQAYGDAFGDLELPFAQRLDRAQWQVLAQMIAKQINSPPTSSLGRLFDAVAALLGLRDVAHYEGQAAIELEMQAAPNQPSYPFTICAGQPATLDVAPMIRAIVADLQQGLPISQIAGRFHRSIAELLATACLHVREQTGLDRVALSGGSFQNRLLLEQLLARLNYLGFEVYLNRRVPPNDGGLSLGQLAVAAKQILDCGF